MILHIPHSSARLPINYDRLPRSYIDEFTDWGTDELFRHSAADRMIAKHSRFYVDVERLVDDPLDEVGSGFFYTHTPDGLHCYRSKLDPEFAQAEMIYKNWHRELKTIAARNISYTENVVLIDCHSFSDKQAGLIHGDQAFPDICIGFNEGADEGVVRMFKTAFEGYSVAENFPFSNAIQPIKADALHCVMVEVNKRLDYTALKPVVTALLDEVARFEFRC